MSSFIQPKAAGHLLRVSTALGAEATVVAQTDTRVSTLVRGQATEQCTGGKTELRRQVRAAGKRPHNAMSREGCLPAGWRTQGGLLKRRRCSWEVDKVGNAQAQTGNRRTSAGGGGCGRLGQCELMQRLSLACQSPPPGPVAAVTLAVVPEVSCLLTLWATALPEGVSLPPQPPS